MNDVIIRMTEVQKRMARLLLALGLTLLAMGCSADVGSEQNPEPTPNYCAPIHSCGQHVPGFKFAGFGESKVGECKVYRYACVTEDAPEDVDASSCEQYWETFCPTPDYDINAGERGE